MDNALDIKESAFNTIVQWLREYNFQVNVSAMNKNQDADIQFEAEVYPPNEKNMFFYVTFRNQFNDSFAITAIMGFSDQDKKSIEGLKNKDQQQIFIDIRKLVYPLNINCDTRFPTTTLHKLIFIDSLRQKQYFFYSVFALVNAMQLASARIDEVRNLFYPEGA